MNILYRAPALSSALAKLKKIISDNEEKGKRTVVFCEDRLTLAAERTVCAAVEGSFLTSVYTFARFLSSERGKCENLLSGQGSAMAVRRIIERRKNDLKLFGRLSSAAAAGEVYDTIALLYSSRITPDDIAQIEAPSPLLNSKLKDLELIYREYSDYLKESGNVDRNAYLRALPEVICSSRKIRGAEVIFLGFQALTKSVMECARACMETAVSVTGLFLGGKEDVYTNEAAAEFTLCARDYGGCKTEEIPSELCAEAEAMRKVIFNPESFSNAVAMPTDKVHIFEAADEDEELEFIAASIIKHVTDEGVRYQSISVMTPPAPAYYGAVERVFTRFGIPFYVDRRYSLAEHPISSFLCGYLACVSDGCTPESVNSIISSPLFAANRRDKDIFINYSLRLAAFRGGVKREPKEEILKNLGFEYAAVEAVRKKFLDGLYLLPRKGTGEEFARALEKLLSLFSAGDILSAAAEGIKEEYPSLSVFSERALEYAQSVLDEAGRITGDEVTTAREFSRVLKSGFTAAEISLIPPKQDAVFVGDITSTANVGTEVLFAAGLTGDVPSFSQDTAILTDRELGSLEKLNVVISPKIMQVNMRSREITALNICSFKKALYLSYPVLSGGEESSAGEIIKYAQCAFTTKSGAKITPLDQKRLERTDRALPYYCARPASAIKQYLKGTASAGGNAAIKKVLGECGYADYISADEECDNQVISARRLYGGFVSPTALENYFSCPYKSFVKQGLKAQERDEGAMRPLDSGNFIHAVLQKLAEEINGLDKERLDGRVKEIAEELLKEPKYSSLTSGKRGEYAAGALVAEAGEVSRGMYEQLANSDFRVGAVESKCEIDLKGLKLFGRIDRVDECGDMVRIIDYKTGTVDSSASSYYAGLKLQLPLYLSAAAEGKRAVGAYYFPAQTEYKDKKDGTFRLKGFMDGSEEVVKSSDKTVEPARKSAYIDCYLNGRKSDCAMSKEDFADFTAYAQLVAEKGAGEMAQGFVSPSPAENACKGCKLSGSCRFTVGVDGEERKAPKATCSLIAEIVRGEGRE